jgi:rhodanese-related sulfurtransferase
VIGPASARWTLRAARQIIEAMAIAPPRHTLEDLLQAAAASITRLRPEEAAAAVGHGATLVDIRSDLDREHDGIVPGSLHIPHTVLEWRLAADSAWRNPYAPDADKHVIVMCDHGCSSVLAAATLVELGFAKASDVIGGYAAWRDAGLVTAPAPRHRRPGELAGMRPVDAPSTSAGR